MAVKKGKMNPLAAGAIGAGIGALVGAGAVALSDEKTRKKIGAEISKLEGKTKKFVSDAQNKMAELTEDTQKEVKKLAKSKK